MREVESCKGVELWCGSNTSSADPSGWSELWSWDGPKGCSSLRQSGQVAIQPCGTIYGCGLAPGRWSDFGWDNSLCACMLQLCPTLCDSVDCHLPGSYVHGILQARMLEWVAIPFSRVSFQPRTYLLQLLPCRKILYCWATGEAHSSLWLKAFSGQGLGGKHCQVLAFQ